jgi:hypothetical protein
VLAHLEERAIVDGKGFVGLPEETSCGADILDDKVPNAHDYLMIVRGQDLIYRGLTKRYRYEVECCEHLFN